jgi:outer membrane PBP1 activator LpoA protein
MHHYALRWVALGILLYGSVSALASAADTLTPAPAVAAANASPIPLTVIGVLLPTQPGQLSASATAVKNGFAAAAEANPGVAEVKWYPTNDKDDNVLAQYQAALKDGVQVIIGPLTKPAIAALSKAGVVNLPTLALNNIDAGPAPAFMVGMPLSVESEARSVARQAAAEGHQIALTLTQEGAFYRRIQQAFADEWQKITGKLVVDVGLPPANKPDSKTITTAIETQKADMMFFAAEAKRAKQVRPYLAHNFPAYGTSQLFTGKQYAPTNQDLQGIKLVEMPWIIDKDDPAGAGIARNFQNLSLDMQRLYALGVDAWQASLLLAKGKLNPGIRLRGVAGEWLLNDDRQFSRHLPLVELGLNPPVAPSAPAAPGSSTPNPASP